MIRILWPTVRPAIAVTAAKLWLEKATDCGDIDFEFGVNSTVDRDVLFNRAKGYTVCLCEDARPGVAAAATHLSFHYAQLCQNNDIIILASDDFEVEQGWDEHLRQVYADFDGALIPNSDYAPLTNILEIPIVSGKLLKQLNGVLYSPFYHHFFSDQELHDIVSEMGVVKNLRGTNAPKFRHRHWSFQGRKRDEFDIRNDKMWGEDKATYGSRESLPLAEKLKLPEGWK